MLTLFTTYGVVFLLAMTPVLELRAAIPAGIAMELRPWLVYLTAVLGNLVPVPFIILFVRKLLDWMKGREGFLRRVAAWVEARATRGAKLFYRYELFGLFLLVAIPLPGTGAWTGALVAALLNLRLRNAALIILAGVCAAGLAVLAAATGLVMLL